MEPSGKPSGPTAHARCNIEDAQSAFLCLLDRQMLQLTQNAEEDLWDLSIAELKALISLLLVRGAYNKNIDMESFWSEEWGLAFFNTATPSNRY